MELDALGVSYLARQLLFGYAMGCAAEETESLPEDPTEWENLAQKTMDPEVFPDIEKLFIRHGSPSELFKMLDEWVDAHPDAEDIREYLLDLMILRILIEGDEDVDMYLESAEWAEVEELTLDRGTELLNFLIYLKDCRENDMKPNIEDFLNEFLFESDEPDQDEFFIYEDFIRHQGCIEGSWKEIIETGASLSEPHIREIFAPIMIFFKRWELTPGAGSRALLRDSSQPGLHYGIYRLITRFWFLDDSRRMN